MNIGQETGKHGNAGAIVSPLIWLEQRIGENKIHQKMPRPEVQPLDHQENGLEGFESMIGRNLSSQFCVRGGREPGLRI